jgi:hypothetical protein
MKNITQNIKTFTFDLRAHSLRQKRMQKEVMEKRRRNFQMTRP